MKIEKTLNGNDMTLKLEGYLDTGTSPELKRHWTLGIWNMYLPPVCGFC